MAAMRQGSGTCAAIQRDNLLSYTGSCGRNSDAHAVRFIQTRIALHARSRAQVACQARSAFASLDKAIGDSRDDNGYYALGGSRA
jgi:hypothetical protein